MSSTERTVNGQHSRRGILRAVGISALARVAVLPVSALLGIVVTRLVIENYGQGAYVQYTLLVGIVALIPFADLGITASIMNATSRSPDPQSDDVLRLTLVSCMRVLLGCFVVVVAVAGVLTWTDAWPVLLGQGLLPGTGSIAAGLCLGLIGVTLLVSFGQRLLMGLGLNHWVILINGLQTPIVLAALVTLMWLGVDAGSYVAVLSYVATLLLAVVCLMLADRRLGPTLRGAFRSAWQVRTVRGARIFDTAWPMLIQMVALPLAMQSDRLVLSHVSTVEDLAQYSLAAQMFIPLVGVVAAAAMSLWPVFAHARAHGTTSPISPFALAWIFAGVASVAVVAVGSVSGPLAQLATGGTIRLPALLVVSFGILVIVQAAKYPVGMYMTDATALRFQAYLVLVLFAVKISLSWVLAVHIGAAGPVLGSVIAVALFQIVPNRWYVRKRMNATPRAL